eukprot:m.142398 g.142398  ORF g.142398 m.142398 type:complete len:50 (-) comp24183_c0_seq7:74-223(-)
MPLCFPRCLSPSSPPSPSLYLIFTYRFPLLNFFHPSQVMKVLDRVWKTD